MFFKGGQATKWSKNLFRQEQDTGIFSIQTWADFNQHFHIQFFLVNTEADVINTLEGSSYYQESQTVDNYLNSFQVLVSNIDYMDPQTLVVKFRQGLQVNIQSQIATIPYRRPADTDPKGQYHMAQKIDQAQLANKAFQSSQYLVPTLSFRIPAPHLSPLSIVYPLVFSMPVPPKYCLCLYLYPSPLESPQMLT